MAWRYKRYSKVGKRIDLTLPLPSSDILWAADLPYLMKLRVMRAMRR
jgi:hypothetical protein